MILFILVAVSKPKRDLKKSLQKITLQNLNCTEETTIKEDVLDFQNIKYNASLYAAMLLFTFIISNIVCHE